MTYAEREAESRHGAEATDDARRRTAQRDETGGVPAPRDSIDEELREGSPVTEEHSILNPVQAQEDEEE